VNRESPHRAAKVSAAGAKPTTRGRTQTASKPFVSRQNPAALLLVTVRSSSCHAEGGPAQVRWFYRERLDSGLAPATVHKLHVVLLRSFLCFPLFTNVVEQVFSEVHMQDPA